MADHNGRIIKDNPRTGSPHFHSLAPLTIMRRDKLDGELMAVEKGKDIRECAHFCHLLPIILSANCLSNFDAFLYRQPFSHSIP